MSALLLEALHGQALEGRKAMVFGASSGLGLACARTLDALGAGLVLVARDARRLDEAARTLTGAPRPPIQESLDITHPDAMAAMLARHDDCDILVSNCGGPPVGPFADVSLEQWDAAWRGQLRSAVQACQALVPGMARRGWGRVVMLASITVVHPLRGFALSNAIRPGLQGLAATLTQTYAQRGVTANLICPGITRTERIEKLIDQAVADGRPRDDVLAEWAGSLPVGRLGRPEEIAAMAGFLASDAAAFISGQCFVLDGGQSVAG